MKILKKRAIACFIDAFIYSSLLEGLRFLIPDVINFWIKIPILGITIFLPFFARDIVFRNASIGKKLLGISIYDKQWKKPSFKLLFLRSLYSIVLFAMFYKIVFVHGNYIGIFDSERNKFETVVIDRKVLKNLEKEAKKMKGDYCANMTELYNAYLRDLYLEKE